LVEVVLVGVFWAETPLVVVAVLVGVQVDELVEVATGTSWL
jgi:hypothetical protein